MFSPEVGSHFWEIWVFAQPDFAEPVQECGLFCADDYLWRATPSEAEQAAERQAQQMASRLRDWLHLGVWSEVLHPDLLPARQGLHACGIDPTTVMVEAVRREAGTHDNEVRPPLGGNWGDGGCVDTVLEPVVVMHGAE